MFVLGFVESPVVGASVAGASVAGASVAGASVAGAELPPSTTLPRPSNAISALPSASRISHFTTSIVAIDEPHS